MKKIVIGIDFSKKTLDASVIDMTRTDDMAKAIAAIRHSQFKNSRSGYKQLLSWVRKQTKAQPSDDWLFCGEDTGKYSLGLCDFLHEQGLFMWLETALRIKNSMGIVRGKSDKADAARIAEYALRHQDKAIRYEPLGETISQLREVFLLRQKLVKQRKALTVRKSTQEDYCKGLDADRFVARQTEKVIKALAKAIKECDRKMKQIIDSDEAVRRTYESITSIKGVSLINAAAFIVYTNNFKGFGGNPRRIATYWGVAVFAKDSGTSVHKPAKTSPMCSRMLKALLTQAAWAAKRHEPRIRQYYDSLIDRGKHKGVALNNVKNKLIHIITALALSGTPYSMTYERDRQAQKAA